MLRARIGSKPNMMSGFVCLFFILFSSMTTWASPINSGQIGRLRIINSCGLGVYLTEVGSNHSQVIRLPRAKSKSHRFYESSPGGVSVKISTVRSNLYHGLSQLQFEYKLDLVKSKIWWDFSSINMNSTDHLVYEGFRAEVSNPQGSNCKDRICRKGDKECLDSYQTPYDDWAISDCHMSSDVTVTLCQQ